VGGARRGRSGLVLGLVAALVVTGAGLGAFVFLRAGTSTPTAPGSPPAPTQTPPRVFFAFQVDQVRVSTLKTIPAIGVARRTANAIAQSLSAFYDQAFANPASWKDGMPEEAWAMFDDSVRDRAQREAGSFTPNTTGVNLVRMDVTTSKLTVKVLVGLTGQPQAAFAKVGFKGTGQLQGGQEVKVDNAVTFLFRPIGKQWLVVGYPDASTTVDTGTSATSPSPSPGSSP
jgi:hypothetical protein